MSNLCIVLWFMWFFATNWFEQFNPTSQLHFFKRSF
jgi:hypothetical protein